jgi:RNA polymerase subunit RPABC4/transcription elongation factor Spt4
MDSMESEYQCAECGAVVSADSKICPNCSASLDDTTEEDCFRVISIPSDPISKSTIKSLLQENNIEYSIVNNSMYSVFGLPRSEGQRLLIHKDQIDAVNAIISRYEKENVPVLETDDFDKASSKEEDKKEQIEGVEGWLLFFCMMLILSPVVYIPYNISTYIELQNEVILFPFKDTILISDLILSILISCLSIYSGLKLWRIRSDAIKTTTLYLNIFLVYSLFIFLLITIIFSISEIPFSSAIQYAYGEFIRDTISSIIFVVFWKIYLKNSERVKNTFS